MKPLLFSLLPDHIAGDLEEESHGKPSAWLYRHGLIALFHTGNLLETAAATAYIIGIPLALTLALRRYVLSNIPLRDSATLSTPVAIALAAVLALLTVTLARVLNRRWLPILLASALTASIVILANAPILLAAAPLLAGVGNKPKGTHA